MLHGFLGSPLDWSSGRPIDLLAEKNLGPEVPLHEWGQVFNEHIKKISTQKKRKIVGYSMGGRLALHALRADPEFWTEAVLLSTHPGLVAELDLQKRLQDDEVWAQRFESEDWQTLLAAWNAQPIFAGSQDVHRSEAAFDRRKLALCLRNWSLGHQKDFRPFLRSYKGKWIAVTGELDKKFTDLWANFVGPEHHMIAKNQGHRLVLRSF